MLVGGNTTTHTSRTVKIGLVEIWEVAECESDSGVVVVWTRCIGIMIAKPHTSESSRLIWW
jgi:hypothetical protein